MLALVGVYAIVRPVQSPKMALAKGGGGMWPYLVRRDIRHLNLRHRIFSPFEETLHFLHIHPRRRIVLIPQHLLLLSRPVSLSFLAIDQVRARGGVTEMLDLPPFVRHPMNPARRSGLNSMFSSGLCNSLTPPSQISLSRI